MELEADLAGGLPEAGVVHNVAVADELTPTRNAGVCAGFVPRRSPRLVGRTVESLAEDDSEEEVDDEVPIVEPAVGMVFANMLDVEAMYKRYAKSKGFAISRVAGSFNSQKERRGTRWRCECYGSPEMKSIKKANKLAKNPNKVEDVRNELVNPKKRMSKKCFCGALLYASVNERKEWVVRSVVLEHSGHTPSPSKVNLVKEYRMESFSVSAARRLDNDFKSGSTVSNIYNCMQNERGGPENTPFLESDLRHLVNGERKKRMEGGDCNALVAYLHKMQSANRQFFYSHRLDSNGVMKDIMWVDPRSREAYKEFCDVVCFDTTYLTNAYKLPFANFVGVNHHGQTILFGCALITHEDAETFEWVFKQWLVAMDGVAPKGILTDQSAAMRKALEVVMPDTRHRWCIWHITQKMPYKLRLNSSYEDIRDDLLDVVYNSLNETDFDRRWAAVIEQYDLQSNEWLKNLFLERHMWVPAFMSDFFWAGMRSTQRVESIHSFFDKYVGANTMFCDFGEKYVAAVESRMKDEKFADDTNSKYSRGYSTGYAAERMFRKIYTSTKFRALQVECERVTYANVIEERQLDVKNMEFMVEDRVWVKPKKKKDVDGVDCNNKNRNIDILLDDHTYYCVKFNTENQVANCSCKKFETDGIMCRHLVRLYDKLHIKEIPDIFILRRWRKDVLRRHTSVRVAFHDLSRTEEVKRLDRMVVVFDELSDHAAKSENCTKIVLRCLRKARDEVLAVKARKETEGDHSIDQTLSRSNASSNGVVETGNSTPNPNDGDSIVGDTLSPALVVSQCSQNVCDTPTSVPHTANAIIDPPIPKKRGRPRATRFKTLCETGWKASQAASGSKSGDCGSAAVVKKKRGRPRKDSCTRQQEVAVDADRDPITGNAPQKMQVKRRKTVTFSDACGDDGYFVGAEDEFASRNGISFGEPHCPSSQ